MKRLFSLVVFSLILSACGEPSVTTVNTIAEPPQSSTTAPPSTTNHRRIGLIMKTLTNPFFVEMEKGARRAETELGVSLEVKTAAQETSIEQQIQIVEDMIKSGIDAIVIAPGDSQRLIPVLKKAIDNGIKVVNIDNRLDPEGVRQTGLDAIPFISVDNEVSAYNAVKYLTKGIETPTAAAILEGIRSADNARQRMEGAKRAFNEDKAIRLVASESANWKIDEAYEVTQKIMSKHPDVKLIFAANDMMALGALKYLQGANLKDVRVASYDALAEAVSEVKAGRLAVTVDQQAAEQGFQGVAMALRLLKGESAPESLLINTKLVTPANVN